MKPSVDVNLRCVSYYELVKLLEEDDYVSVISDEKYSRKCDDQCDVSMMPFDIQVDVV